MKTYSKSAAALGLSLMSLFAFTPETKDQALLGRSPDDIIEMFGVPDSVRTNSQTVRFAYEDPANESAYFTFHHDVAISVPPKGFQPLKVTRPTAGKLYHGQSVRSAALQVGNVTSTSIGSNSVIATYEMERKR